VLCGQHAPTVTHAMPSEWVKPTIQGPRCQMVNANSVTDKPSESTTTMADPTNVPPPGRHAKQHRLSARPILGGQVDDLCPQPVNCAAGWAANAQDCHTRQAGRQLLQSCGPTVAGSLCKQTLRQPRRNTTHIPHCMRARTLAHTVTCDICHTAALLIHYALQAQSVQALHAHSFHAMHNT
jgi:hypothetical protein